VRFATESQEDGFHVARCGWPHPRWPTWVCTAAHKCAATISGIEPNHLGVQVTLPLWPQLPGVHVSGDPSRRRSDYLHGLRIDADNQACLGPAPGKLADEGQFLVEEGTNNSDAAHVGRNPFGNLVDQRRPGRRVRQSNRASRRFDIGDKRTDEVGESQSRLKQEIGGLTALHLDPLTRHPPCICQQRCALRILGASHLNPVGDLAVVAEPRQSQVVAADQDGRLLGADENA